MSGIEPAPAAVERADIDRPADKRLSLRDYLLLFLTVILTLAFIGCVSEFGARLIWPQQDVDQCETWVGENVTVAPNCRATVKAAEGQWVEYHYNECASRSAASCGPKPANALRFVTIGTSISRGYWVAYSDSFSGRLEQSLGRSCKRPVEIHNLSYSAYQNRTWETAAQQTDRAMQLDPDGVILVVSSFDMLQWTPPSSSGGATAPAASSTVAADFVSILGQLRGSAGDSRAMTMAMHFAFEDPDRYLRFFIQHGDSADYLRPGMSPAWHARLEMVDAAVGKIAAATKAAHVPFFLLLAPLRPGILLAHSRAEFPDLDPNAFPNALAEIARRHGAVFVDPTHLQSTAPNWNELYMVADGHPNARGHQLIAKALQDALLENVGALRTCAASPAAGVTRSASLQPAQP